VKLISPHFGFFLTAKIQKFFNGDRYYVEELGLDEASQLSTDVLEPVIYTLIPLGLKRIVTFGDSAQLNPFGTSPDRPIPSVLVLLHRHHKGCGHVRVLGGTIQDLLPDRQFGFQNLLWKQIAVTHQQGMHSR
jgi:hypothetical protein